MTIGSILIQSSIVGYITSPYTVWFPVVISGAIAIIGILALIYMFSAFIGREDIRVWIKVKMYEVLLSIVLILVFLFIVTLISSLNFPEIFNSAGIVPGGCKPPLDSAGLPANDLFSLALCDMHEFNQNVLDLNRLIYLISLDFSFVPQVYINASRLLGPPFGVPGIGIAGSLSPPVSAFTAFSGYLLDALYTAYVVSQVQLLLLAASLLLFSLFLSIGLIARIFVVTRSFGGSMIAFGVGLGILYPLLVCLTYGYIVVGMETSSFVVNISVVGVIALTVIELIGLGPLTGQLAAVIAGLGAGSPLGSLLPGGVFLEDWITGLLKYAGLAGAGLLVIPILNFVIIDVFIIDFSQAIGERMDFMSLLTRII